MSKSIGVYIDNESNESYEVFEVTNKVIHPATTGARVLPASKKYRTESGITAQKLNDDLSSFELIEKDGIIHKLNT